MALGEGRRDAENLDNQHEGQDRPGRAAVAPRLGELQQSPDRYRGRSRADQGRDKRQRPGVPHIDPGDAPQDARDQQRVAGPGVPRLVGQQNRPGGESADNNKVRREQPGPGAGHRPLDHCAERDHGSSDRGGAYRRRLPWRDGPRREQRTERDTRRHCGAADAPGTDHPVRRNHSSTARTRWLYPGSPATPSLRNTERQLSSTAFTDTKSVSAIT